MTIERQSAIARPIPAVLPPINASLPLVSHPSCRLHAIYDADADRPIYAEVTPAKVNEISVAQEMPIEAGAAAEVLAYVFPEHAAFFREKAEEATRSRLAAGVNYPSDIAAGLELGREVAALAIARAKSDGTEAKWNGSVPAGPGTWTDTNPILPMAGTWKPWVLASQGEFRPGPPVAY